MERRNFVVGTVVFLGAMKSAFGLGKTKKLNLDNSLNELDLNADVVYLKRNEIVTLPANPESISTVITFDTSKYRFGKSPEIHLNGKKIDGLKKENLILTKDIPTKHKTKFIMQYTGEDVGWIVLV